MARIQLAETFILIPEGHYVFRIDSVVYNEDFGNLKIMLSTESGRKHVENLNLKRDANTVNDGAMAAFSATARAAIPDLTGDDIDPQDLVGHFFECDITHNVKQSTRDANKTVTFVKMSNKRPSDGWSVNPLDLGALLGE